MMKRDIWQLLEIEMKLYLKFQIKWNMIHQYQQGLFWLNNVNIYMN